MLPAGYDLISESFRRARVNAVSVIFLLVPVAQALAASQAGFAAWSDSADFILDTSPGGADLESDLEGYPLSIRLDGADFDFARAQAQGQDVRFTNRKGDVLPHRIEEWDRARKRATVWVRLDSVKGNDAEQGFRMYWGNPSAPAASGQERVFPSGEGHVGAWHLGKSGAEGSSTRPNSVANGQGAQPVFFDGDEGCRGVLAACDSLDGAGNPGDHFILGHGYADFTSGFTFSAWVNPAGVVGDAGFIDLSNGDGLDNISVSRDGAGNGLRVLIRHPTVGEKSARVQGALESGVWQHIAVSIADDGQVDLFRNGRRLYGGAGLKPIYRGNRTWNFLGCSSRRGAGSYRGKLDEVRLDRVWRSEDWFRLDYATQRPGQTALRRGAPPTVCASGFRVPPDTSVAEGEMLTLAASAGCATRMSWTVESGPAPRILDPEVLELTLRAPRISGDTDMVYRFTATQESGILTGIVRVHVREAIPEPDFQLPPSFAWSGRSRLDIKPVIPGLAAILASPAPDIVWNWAVEPEDWPLDTAWLPDGMTLLESGRAGTFRLGLCLDNGGERFCRSTEVQAGLSSSVSGLPLPWSDASSRESLHDAAGRRTRADKRGTGPLFNAVGARKVP